MASARSSARCTTRMPLPPPPARRLEQHRVADLARRPRASSASREPGAVRAGHDRHPGLGHRLLGADLVAHRLDRRRRAARRRRSRPPRRPRRTRRSRRGSRSRGGSPARRCARAASITPVDRQVALRRRRRPDPDRDVGRARRAGRRRRRRSTRRPSGSPARAACGSPGRAISPRLATSTVSNMSRASHPEDAEGRVAQRARWRRRTAPGPAPCGCRRVDHAVVPQPGGGVVGVALASRTAPGSAP